MIRTFFRWLLALLFVLAGVWHFVNPAFYLKIMPRYLPYHLELIYVSGAFEILGGVGILIPRLRRIAGVGLILLLIAVFPANVFMFRQELKQSGWSPYGIGLFARLWVQPLIAWWVWAVSRSSEDPKK